MLRRDTFISRHAVSFIYHVNVIQEIIQSSYINIFFYKNQFQQGWQHQLVAEQKNLGIDKQTEVVTDQMFSSHNSGKKIENIQKLQ